MAVTAPSQLLPDASATGTPVAALRQRLSAAARVLGVDTGTTRTDPADAASELFGRLVEHVHRQPGSSELWLLMTALTAVLPDPDQVQAAVRTRDLTGPSDLGTWLLEAGWGPASSAGALELEMDVVSDSVVVDVDFSARHDLHTGIQRVVRETLPRWARDHEMTLVAWTDPGGAMRHLVGPERNRVLHWHDRTRSAESSDGVARHRIVVPWRSRVLLPENPPPEHCPAIAAISLYSGNAVGLIGYDLIPAISPELIHVGLPDRFMRYLQAVKHADRVVGISGAATREFRGFAAMLAAQGLTGPTVVECSLPVEVPPGEPLPPGDLPLVVSIGSFEPRKNQLAVLHAAEHLWREGLRFRVQFIGGGGWATEFDGMLARLRSAGRPVERRTAITDEELWGTVRSARFTVFPSLHEGFGLPVAESLACGVPCLTSDRGSTLEIAEGGGALVVDPMDDEQIADQMRRLLTDDALLEDLHRQALARPLRTWDDYARELWAHLVPATSGTSAETDR
jgi:glycosyltransferase involved in cell wall biosynthesis